MAQSLYQKYRPQTFAEVVGQDHVKTALQNALTSGRVVAAYLFTGPRGLGKTTLARLLAKAVNCQKRKDGQFEPCNACDTCRQITEGRNLDVMEIDAASHTGVDNVRESIIATARLSPSQSRYKVFIIDEVHMLSLSAFNALLKTLEEPPAHVIFILATTEIHKVPPTIVSRCQRYDFRKVSQADMITRLETLCAQEHKKVPGGVLASVARKSEGCVRDAESLLGQILSLGDQEITQAQAELVLPRSRADLALQMLEHISLGNLGPALGLINQLVEDGVDVQFFTRDVIEVLRCMLLQAAGAPLEATGVLAGEGQMQEAEKLARRFGTRQLALLVDRFVSVAQQLKFSDIVQLPLEIAMAELIDTPAPANPAPVAQAFSAKADRADKHDETPKDPPNAANSEPTQEKSKPKKSKPVLALGLEQVREKWDEVLAQLKGHNHSLASTMRQHRPSAVRDDGSLEFQFKYKFHEQRVNEVRNRQILETVLENIFGQKFRIQTVVVERPAGAEQDPSVQSLLSAFGGQLVD